jgi:uncharacterized protein YuzE
MSRSRRVIPRSLINNSGVLFLRAVPGDTHENLCLRAARIAVGRNQDIEYERLGYNSDHSVLMDLNTAREIMTLEIWAQQILNPNEDPLSQTEVNQFSPKQRRGLRMILRGIRSKHRIKYLRITDSSSRAIEALG